MRKSEIDWKVLALLKCCMPCLPLQARIQLPNLSYLKLSTLVKAYLNKQDVFILPFQLKKITVRHFFLDQKSVDCLKSALHFLFSKVKAKTYTYLLI